MRKKIALLQGEITGKFKELIMRALQVRANELGYDVIGICTYGSYNDDTIFADGEKACSYIVDYESFDGIVVSEDFFDVPGMADEIYNHLREHATCPVVYLRTQREGCFSILVENYESIKMMANHFIKDHGFTDICYMSGKKDLWDARERLRGFKDAMKEAGLEVNDSMIFHGDYWREKGKAAVDYFMKGRTSYPQAIVCANDFMALSVCEALRERGIRVPEDVCVSGFDYVEEARLYDPSITSLYVDFEDMAREAINIIDDVNMGVHRDFITWMIPDLKLQKSCGCGEQFQFDNISEMIEENYQQVFIMKNVMLSSIEYQDAFEEDEYLAIADRYFSIFKCDKAYLCLCDTEEEGYMSVENETRFTDKMILKRIFNQGYDAEKLDISFDRKTLLPVEYLDKENIENFLIFSIHFKNQVFGYMVAKFPEKKWFDIYSQSYLLNLASAIKNATVQNMLVSLEEIKSLYQKDALTGLYNRRGFDRLAREKFADAQENDKYLSFVSVDMDGLKYINDTFGHTEGDKAINKVADVINSVLLEDEIAARVGGDEFLIILCNGIENRDRKFIEDFNAAIREKNDETLMYPVSASVGICSLKENPSYSMQACMQSADFAMYENKRSKVVNRI